MRIPTVLLLAGCVAALLHAIPVRADEGWPGVERWRFSGNDLGNTRSSPDTWLYPSTARYLHPLWSFTTAGDVSATPTIEGDDLYVPDWGGYVYKLNRWSGNVLWKVKLSDLTGNLASVSRTAPAIADNDVILGDQAGGIVYAINKSNGALHWKSVVEAHPAALITSSPIVNEGKVYVGVASREEGLAIDPSYVPSFRGSVASLDLATGQMIWQFHTTGVGYTGAGVWASLAIDPKRRVIFVSTGNNYSIPPSVTHCLLTNTRNPLSCVAPDNWFDSVLALNLDSGGLRWGRRLWNGPDTYTLACIYRLPACPTPQGPDYDFGAGPGLFSLTSNTGGDNQDNQTTRQLLGIGQKSGIYWALDPNDGHTVWSTQVGPVGPLGPYGGIVWGPAVDGKRVYVAINNDGNATYRLADGTIWNAGSWAALDARTGHFIWQIKVPGIDPATQKGGRGLGAVSVANGVMFAGSTSGDMVAIDGATGKILWSFASGGTVASGPSIANHGIYWGSGYRSGTHNNKLYGFTTN